MAFPQHNSLKKFKRLENTKIIRGAHCIQRDRMFRSFAKRTQNMQCADVVFRCLDKTATNVFHIRTSYDVIVQYFPGDVTKAFNTRKIVEALEIRKHDNNIMNGCVGCVLSIN